MADGKLTLADFEAMKNRTGLVPMRVLRAFAPYYKGTTHGFSPKTAYTHYINGDAETIQGASVKATPTDAEKAAAKAAITTKSVPGPTNEPPPPPPPAAGEVEIPAGWKDEHHMRRLNWAAKIRGIATKDIAEMADTRHRETGVDTHSIQIADEIIREYVEKRKG